MALSLAPRRAARRMPRLRLAAVPASLALRCWASARAAPQAAPDAVLAESTDRMIIRCRDGSAAALRPDSQTMARAHELMNRAGVPMTRVRGNAMAAQVMQLGRAVGVAAMRRLAANLQRQDSGIDYAEPDLRLQTQWVPSDAGYLSQWAYFEPTTGQKLPTA